MGKHSLSRRKVIIAALLVLTLIPLSLIVHGEGTHLYKKYQENKKFEDLAAIFIPKCLENVNQDDHTAIQSALRDCVNSYSQHKIDEEYFRHSKKPHFKLGQIVAYMQGEADYPPHMECSTRSRVLQRLYKTLGYETRELIVTKYLPEYNDHVQVEVFDPDQASFIVQDPSHNVSFYNASGRPLDAIGILTTPEEHILLCAGRMSCTPEQMIEERASYIDKVAPYFGNIYVIPNYNSDKAYVAINKERFKMDEPLTFRGEIKAYCDVYPKRCRNPVLYY